jgi:hypothetical protein
MAGFVTRGQYATILREEGFTDVRTDELTMGVAAIVKADACAKPEAQGNANANGDARTS